MLKRNLWKIVLSCALITWAIFSIIPIQNTPFSSYVQSEVSARHSEFEALMREANQRVEAGQAQSDFVALKEIAAQRKIDLAQFFPHLRLESSLRNIEKRNAILLDHLLRESRGRLQLGLDLRGGVAFTLEVAEQPTDTQVHQEERQQKLAKAIEIISDRIDAFGVAEPIVRPVGENRIEVQLPGVSVRENPEVVAALRKPARLDFRRVHPQLSPENTSLDDVPPGYEVLALTGETRGGETYEANYFVRRIPDMTGEGVANAFATMDEYGRWRIILRFTSEGSQQFADVTGAIADEGRRTGQAGLLAIVLDGRLYSAPRVQDRISGGSAEITGSFTRREAEELANVLNNPLDLPLEVMEMNEIGATLADDAVSSGVRASIIGIALVAAFMITIYTVGGVVALVSLAVNILIILGMLAALGATISLPGVAGIVLTIGMAVDSNILIFERIREELGLGKSLRAAFQAGYEKVTSTILDANLTTLIASGLMMAFGTGPVKGFGVTLTIGVFSTMFCALIVTRLLLELPIESEKMKRFPMLIKARTPSIDFLKYARPAFILSWTVVLIGVGVVAWKGDRIYGIDFVGGDEVSVVSQARPSVTEIRTVLEGANLGEVNPLPQMDLAGTREVLRIQVPFGQGERVLPILQQQFPQAGFDQIGQTTIGPAVGAEIRWNAIMSMALAIVGILLYVAFRFEMGFGMGAVVSTIHDILMTIGIFVLTDRQFTAPMVAAILLIAGYSINDTIVVFDRIREELKNNPMAKLRDIINLAINKVFTRSLLTSITTFLAAFSLYLFGGGVINDLAFTFLVGVVTGTFSSIFIASPIFFWWHKGDRKHVEQHQDVKPTYEWTGASKASQ
jgi:SecD/SecF fusion protein